MENPEQLIRDLYAHLLRRMPGDKELDSWADALRRGEAFESIFYKFVKSSEYKSKQRLRCLFPDGHFHSPVVDPDSVKTYVDWSVGQPLRGITIDIDRMRALFERHIPMFRATRLPSTKESNRRYYLDGSPFPYGDALSLRAMLAEHRPPRIVEIGSGFSTAVMLDAVEDFGFKPRIVCIEPDPTRLKSLMRAGDLSVVEIVSRNLQTVDLRTFEMLEPGDLLFIDSTHVMKTGSDVHYELFHILPTLKPGVLVHVHDIQYPFEYPAKWIYEDNYSWNETYALRAFLMYNSRFDIVFLGELLAPRTRSMVSVSLP